MHRQGHPRSGSGDDHSGGPREMPNDLQLVKAGRDQRGTSSSASPRARRTGPHQFGRPAPNPRPPTQRHQAHRTLLGVHDVEPVAPPPPSRVGAATIVDAAWMTERGGSGSVPAPTDTRARSKAASSVRGNRFRGGDGDGQVRRNTGRSAGQVLSRVHPRPTRPIAPGADTEDRGISWTADGSWSHAHRKRHRIHRSHQVVRPEQRRGRPSSTSAEAIAGHPAEQASASFGLVRRSPRALVAVEEHCLHAAGRRVTCPR